MMKAPLWISLTLAFSAVLLFHSFHLFYFAPVIAITIHRYSLLQSLWIATLIGLGSDLLSFDTHFGLYALLTALSTLFAYRFRRWFYEERLFSLPLFTGLISSIFFLLKSLFLIRAPLWMPFADAAYAFLWFTCPLFVYTLITRRRLS